MNKRILVILAVLLTICMMLAACGEEPAHEHSYDKTAWMSDATMHWHKATCGHDDAMADVQGHIDENHDGVCDVCQYAGDHTHSFDTDWEYDATGHWHEANCFHDIKDGFSAHTADEMGFCTECGYKVSEPDVSSIKKAIEVAVAQKDTVKHGNITSMDWSERSIDFEYRNGYLYIKEGTTEKYYSLTADGQVLGVIRESAWDNITVYRDMLATEDNLDGPEIPAGFIDHELTFYGTEDLVSALHAMGWVDNLNADYTESIENGVYSFSFGYYIEGYGLYVISVEFTLDPTTYAFATVVVESVRYGVDSIEVVTEATETAPAVYAPKVGAEGDATASVEIVQGIDAANPFDPADLIATDFELFDKDGNKIENNIVVEQGGYVNVYLGELFPDSALIDFVLLEVAGENVNLEFDDPNWANSLSAYPYEGYIEIGSRAAAGTTYTLEISVNGAVKTYTVTVKAPVPTFIGAGQLGEEYGNTTVNTTDSVVMTEGDSVVIGAYLDKNAGEITVTVNGVAADSSALGSFSFWELEQFDRTCYGTSYDLGVLEVGEYTVTFTSTVNADLTVSVNVTVNEQQVTPQPPVETDPPAGGEDETDPPVGGDSESLKGSGTADDPYVIIASGTYTASVPEEDFVFYIVRVPSTGSIELSFDAGSDCSYGYGTFSFGLCDMTTNATTSAPVIQGNTFYLKVTTQGGAEGQVTFDITLPTGGSSSGNDMPGGNTPSGDFVTPTGSGTDADPFVIAQSGSYAASIPSEGTVCYVFTATSDCTVTLSTSGSWWAEYGTYSFMLCDGIDSSGSFSKNVTAGQTLYIKISTLEYSAVTENVEFTVTIA